jgi:hypothetical protein
MPLQAAPTDPVVLEKLEAFTEKYGYEFAEFPPGPWGLRVRFRRAQRYRRSSQNSSSKLSEKGRTRPLRS